MTSAPAPVFFANPRRSRNAPSRSAVSWSGPMPRAPPVISGVIFDMDGVLVDSEPVHLAATRELLAGYGVPFADADKLRDDADSFGQKSDKFFK